MNQWLFRPVLHANQYVVIDPALTPRKHFWARCTPGHLMYSLAEVANLQRHDGNSLQLGQYLWPQYGLSARGIDYVTDPEDTCTASTTGNTADIELFCRTKVYLCIDARPDDCWEYYPYKTSVVWEKSIDGGLTWAVLDEGKINLTGNVLIIGQSNWFENSSAYRTQFYGLIDSVRISVGTPRYTGDVAQPFARRCLHYYPQAAVGAINQDVNGKPIDEHVSFALNLWNYGDILIRDPMAPDDVDSPDAYVPVVHMPPGSTVIPYYVKERGQRGGYHVAGDVQNPLFTAETDLAPEIRQLNTSLSAAAIKDRQLLSYSNISSGLFKQWPAIQFPAHTDTNIGAQNSPTVYQALALEDKDFLPKVNSGKTRVIDVRLATTDRLIGKLSGPFRTIDGLTAEVGDLVLVKDQDDPKENGVYTVRGRVAEQNVDWARLVDENTGLIDDLTGVYVRVTGGTDNIGTSWIMTAASPVIGQDPIIFAQDKILGTYTEDFCVESWFNVSSFGHPAPSSFAAGQSDFPYLLGAEMTLLETYYRRLREQAEPYSGLRIYFKPEETTRGPSKTGRVYVDFWVYSSPLDSANATNDSWKGPVFVSDVIAANQFHHVAVVRNQNIFALYVNGIKQDEIEAQQKKFNPAGLTAEQNTDLYRARGFYGPLVDVTDSLSILVKAPEFTYVADDSPEYAKNFNGAGGMLVRDGLNARLINLPCGWYKEDATFDENGNCSGFVAGVDSSRGSVLASWPGVPVPNKPADNHVYIINDNAYIQETGELPFFDFLFVPTMRFPDLTYSVELATVADGTTDIYDDELLDTGNIDTELDPNYPLYGTTILRIHEPTGFPQRFPLTIDGVAVEEGMRVLVQHQTNEAQNGVYVVKEDAWVRVEDLRTREQLQKPYRALVRGGFTNAGSAFVLDIDPLIPVFEYQIDITPLEFKKDTDSSSSGERFECYIERSVCRGEGVEVADEPVVLVIGRTVSNVDLSVGGFPGSTNVPYAAYDGTLVTSGFHRVLVAGQNNAAENGIYIMNAIGWTRVTDLDNSVKYRELRARAKNGEILVSPSGGSKTGPGCSVGYRIILENSSDFLLGVDAIDVLPNAELLNKLYVPTTWVRVSQVIDIDEDTQLPLVSSGQQVRWSDQLPDTDDKGVWRIWTKCGNAVHYSRNLVIRMATALNITQIDQFSLLSSPECP